jgi:hypothetical protein
MAFCAAFQTNPQNCGWKTFDFLDMIMIVATAQHREKSKILRLAIFAGTAVCPHAC